VGKSVKLVLAKSNHSSKRYLSALFFSKIFAAPAHILTYIAHAFKYSWLLIKLHSSMADIGPRSSAHCTHNGDRLINAEERIILLISAKVENRK